MKAFLVLVITLITIQAYSTVQIIDSISCEALKRPDVELMVEVYLKLTGFIYDNDSKVAQIDDLSITVINKGAKSYGLVPLVEASTFDVTNLKNIPYQGRIYTDHYKFNITENEKVLKAGNLDLTTANVIISPSYSVVKSFLESNYYDPQKPWKVEIRKYSAVFDVHLNDQMGDYIKLECYSLVKLNEK